MKLSQIRNCLYSKVKQISRPTWKFDLEDKKKWLEKKRRTNEVLNVLQVRLPMYEEFSEFTTNQSLPTILYS